MFLVGVDSNEGPEAFVIQEGCYTTEAEAESVGINYLNNTANKLRAFRVFEIKSTSRLKTSIVKDDPKTAPNDDVRKAA